jgi:GR25 family glycosyltransferase involved in LPS biosynthesis
MTKIYVISVENNNERRLFFSKSHTNLNFRYFNAIDLKGKKIPFINDYKIKINTNFSVGAFGCLLSHRRILKNFINSREEGYITILEDDINLNIKKYQYLIQKIDKAGDFDILFLGANNLNSYPIINIFNNKFLAFNLIAKPIEDTLYCSYAYIISRKGAMKLLKEMKIGTPIDYWNNYRNIEYRVIYPNIAVPNKYSLNSSITENKVIKKDFIIIWLIKCFYHNLFNNTKRK